MGSEIWNRLPLPSSLSTWMLPSMLSTSRLTMDIPRPVPSMRLIVVFCARSKGRKMRCKNSWLMPTPLSRQEKSNQTAGPSGWSGAGR